MPKAIPDPPRLYTCAWCGDRKLIAEMRNVGSAKGRSPSTCRNCREAHSDESWCDFHAEPHPVDRFRPHSATRPGVRNECQEATAQRLSRTREVPPAPCLACGVVQDSWFFRGGRRKALVCRSCQDGHPGERWCVDCVAWLADVWFNRTGVDGVFWTVRCKPCRSAHSHGTTVAELLRIQGSDRPECAACGSLDHLKVDHDHACCPTTMGCRNCVRGYLCHACNTAEGLLRTPDRARALAVYMEKVIRRGRVA